MGSAAQHCCSTPREHVPLGGLLTQGSCWGAGGSSRALACCREGRQQGAVQSAATPPSCRPGQHRRARGLGKPGPDRAGRPARPLPCRLFPGCSLALPLKGRLPSGGEFLKPSRRQTHTPSEGRAPDKSPLRGPAAFPRHPRSADLPCDPGPRRRASPVCSAPCRWPARSPRRRRPGKTGSPSALFALGSALDHLFPSSGKTRLANE